MLKLHTKKINWWSSHGVFECYNHEELEYSEEDFAIDFVVSLYLLFEIYLLYIQFIVNTSCYDPASATCITSFPAWGYG